MLQSTEMRHNLCVCSLDGNIYVTHILQLKSLLSLLADKLPQRLLHLAREGLDMCATPAFTWKPVWLMGVMQKKKKKEKKMFTAPVQHISR